MYVILVYNAVYIEKVVLIIIHPVLKQKEQRHQIVTSINLISMLLTRLHCIYSRKI